VYFGGSGTQNSLTNYGILKGGQYGVHALDGDETIVNRGTIKGDIVLGGGDDSFDNRHGTVDHAVTGGAGDDTLIVDDGKTKLVESKGEGNDTVESSASYKLGANVENLVLIGKGDINGTGNSDANELSGTNGDNVLVGRGGADTLNGHRGDDILSGGAGSDLFLFSKGSGHDVIKDFKPGEDHIDVSGLNGIVDFDEMIAHHLKVSGDDLVIHAGNDSITLEHVSKAALDFHDFYY
jgi:Ca2+-binding RTX toxin-like protein